MGSERFARKHALQCLGVVWFNVYGADTCRILGSVHRQVWSLGGWHCGQVPGVFGGEFRGVCCGNSLFLGVWLDE